MTATIASSARPTRSVSAVFASTTSLRLATVIVVLVAWQLASAAVGEHSLSGPGATAQAFAGLMVNPVFWTALGQTLLSTVLGLVIAAAIAIPVGLVIAASKFATDSTRLTLDFLSSIPPVSFLPLALLLFGPELPMKLLLIAYGTCWPLLLRTIDSLRDVDAVQRDVADAFDIPRSTRWRRIYVPAALPGMLVGFRVALTISLLLSVVAEYIGGADGLGAQLWNMQSAGLPAEVQAYAVVAAVLGVLLNVGMRAIERSAISWHPSVRTGGRA